MKKTLKVSLLSLAIMGFTTSAFAATTLTSQPLTGTAIKGYIPHINSIGTRVVLGGQKDANGNLLSVNVGDVIEVPTYLTADELVAMGLQTEHFDFGDLDGDAPASLGKDFLDTAGNSHTGTQEFLIEWYAITPKDAKAWDAVASWNDVDATVLPGAFYQENTVSKALVIPAEAGGKRIGFKATPVSEFGLPNKGVPIYAWDLNKFWKQNPPNKPGDCLLANDECSDKDNQGTPNGENANGGGGVIGTPDGVVNIFNADGTLVKPNDSLFVNSTYYATIQVKDGENYREPTEDELKSLKWYVTDETGTPVATYTAADSTRVKGTAAEAKSPTGFNKYEFSTQTKNTDAADLLKNREPNFSEQGLSLKVEIEVDVK